jgi:hypothetical protein
MEFQYLVPVVFCLILANSLILIWLGWSPAIMVAKDAAIKGAHHEYRCCESC